MQAYHLTRIDCFTYIYNLFTYVKIAHFLKDDILQEEGQIFAVKVYFISYIDMLSLLKKV